MGLFLVCVFYFIFTDSLFFRVGGFSAFWLLWILRGFFVAFAFRILCIHSSSLFVFSRAFAFTVPLCLSFRILCIASSAAASGFLALAAFWLPPFRLKCTRRPPPNPPSPLIESSLCQSHGGGCPPPQPPPRYFLDFWQRLKCTPN